MAFCDAVVAHGTRQSATAQGPGDNAHAESFWLSLRAELTRGVLRFTDHLLRTARGEYIMHDSRRRLHSSLNCTSPIASERWATQSHECPRQSCTIQSGATIGVVRHIG